MDDKEKRELIALLKELGVSRVTIHFDGAGDSGQVEGIEFTGIVGKQYDKVVLTPHDCERIGVNDTNSTYDTTTKTTTKHGSTLHEALDELASALLEQTGVDWYNNDGGYGVIEIIPTTGRIYCDMNQRYTSSVSSGFDFGFDESGNVEAEWPAEAE